MNLKHLRESDAERRENPEHLRIGITNRMILGGMSGPDAIRLLDEYVAARSTPAEALDAFREILTKLIRQYHGVAHSDGSWLRCDDRWCADMRQVLS